MHTNTFDWTDSELGLGALELSQPHWGAPHVWAGATASADHRPNQDAWKAARGVWAVADGMGARDHAAQAALFAVQRFVAVAPVRTGSHPASFVRELNSELIDRLGSASGTTLVAAVLVGTSLDVVHIGDSRIYRLRDGVLELVTRDHTVRELALELGEDPNSLTPKEVQGLTSFLGQPSSLVTVGLRSLKVAPGDRLLFLTDGIHRSVSFDDLGDAMRTEPVATLPQALIRSARLRGSIDDATALAVEFVDS